MSPPPAKSSVSQETPSQRRGLLVRWWGLWILLGLGSIVALSWLLPQALGAFGLGALTLPLWLWLILKVTAGNRWRWVSRHPQLWLAAIVFHAALQGLLAFYFEPKWLVIGKASIQQVSSGGLIGQAILGTPDWLGGVRVGSLAFMGIFILSPRGVWRAITALGRLKPALLLFGRFLKATVAVIFSILSWFFRALWDFSTILTRFLVRVVPIILRRRRTRPEAPDHPVARPHPKSAEARESPHPPARREPVSPAPGPAGVRATASPPPPRHQAREEPASAPAKGTASPWPLPPLEILERTPVHEFNEADVKERARLIEEALASYGVDASVEQINPGPVVTQFGVEPGWDKKYRQVVERNAEGRPKLDRSGKPKVSRVEIEGTETRVKVERITALANNLAMALAVPSVRIEAPVPGQALVGIEVPNRSFNTVGLRGVIEGNTFQKLRARTNLALALGRGAGGEVVVADLAKMPHLLIAGATGSGKTVCLNSAIACLLMHNTPENARMVMIDPKRVELTPYNYIPHLLSPVIVDTDTAIEALKRLNREMDTRYKKLASLAVRNIEVYNRDYAAKNGPMPYILVFVDELADLMMAAPDVVEPLICRLAQLARATGIHLVVATQRPSVDVVTGLIKANFPTRISFAVTSQVDSRTILDGAGAEKLLGRGDMLYLPTDAAKPKRLQGVYVSDPEIDRLVAHWRRWGDANYQDTVASAFASLPAQGASDDPLLQRARQLAKEHTRLSASFLQRRLQIGYSRAQEILEILEAEAAVNTKESIGPGVDASSSPAAELDQGRK